MNKKNIDYTLYLVTDRDLLGNRDLCESIEEAILGGVTVVQLREKFASTLEFYQVARKVKDITKKYGVPLIINDRLDIALAVDAEGLHIGQKDMPLNVARNILGNDKIIGVSAATLEEAKLAEDEGADCVGIGAMFTTSTKKDARHVSLDTLKEIKRDLKIPVVAIGGIHEENVKKVMNTGIDGVAIVSAILTKEDIREGSKNIYKLIKE